MSNLENWLKKGLSFRKVTFTQDINYSKVVFVFYYILVHSWKKHSKVLRPLFRNSNLNEYVCVFQKYSEQVLMDLDELYGEDNKNSFEDVFYKHLLKTAYGKKY